MTTIKRWSFAVYMYRQPALTLFGVLGSFMVVGYFRYIQPQHDRLNLDYQATSSFNVNYLIVFFKTAIKNL